MTLSQRVGLLDVSTPGVEIELVSSYLKLETMNHSDASLAKSPYLGLRFGA